MPQNVKPADVTRGRETNQRGCKVMQNKHVNSTQNHACFVRLFPPVNYGMILLLQDKNKTKSQLCLKSKCWTHPSVASACVCSLDTMNQRRSWCRRRSSHIWPITASSGCNCLFRMLCFRRLQAKHLGTTTPEKTFWLVIEGKSHVQAESWVLASSDNHCCKCFFKRINTWKCSTGKMNISNRL